MVKKGRFPHRSRMFLVIIGAMIIGRKEELNDEDVKKLIISSEGLVSPIIIA